MGNLEINFGIPNHGWLPVEVKSPSASLHQEVSDVPGNTILELVQALSRLSLGSSQELVQWSLEPGLWSWSFDVSGETLKLTMEEPDGSIFHYVMPKLDALQIIHSSLIKLGANTIWTSIGDSETAWSWDFPKDEVFRFGDHLGGT